MPSASRPTSSPSTGAGFADIATDLHWVLGYTVAFFALGVVAFRRSMTE